MNRKKTDKRYKAILRPLILQGCWTSPPMGGVGGGHHKGGGPQTLWSMPKGCGPIQGGHQEAPVQPLPHAKQRPVQWAAPRGPASSPRLLGWLCTRVGFGVLHPAGRHRQCCLRKCKIPTSEDHVCGGNKRKLQSDSWNSHVNQKKPANGPLNQKLVF